MKPLSASSYCEINAMIVSGYGPFAVGSIHRFGSKDNDCFHIQRGYKRNIRVFADEISEVRLGS